MANAYFDAAYYLKTYPDLAPQGVTLDTAWEHYVQHGAGEGRQANAWFDTAYYALNNPDLAAGGLMPWQLLDHYTSHGAGEGRQPTAWMDTAWFDAAYYASRNADVAQALAITNPAALSSEQVAGLISHYVYHGAELAEGRQPNAWFDGAFYLAANADLAAAGVAPAQALHHYVQHGYAEGRKPAAWFDPAHYARLYADIRAAFGIDEDFTTLSLAQSVALANHFQAWGMKELRSPQAGVTLDAAKLQAYAVANADLRVAFDITDLPQLTAAQQGLLARHFFEHGYKEARAGAPAVIEPVSGARFDLTTVNGQVVVGTAFDDVIVGTVSPLAARNTLRERDQIDGGAGKDTLRVALEGDFDGFDGGGFLKNVEVIELTNADTVKHSFQVDDVMGIQVINLLSTNGSAINVYNIQPSGVTINVTGVKQDTTLGFDEDAFEQAGARTDFVLGLNQVGSADTAVRIMTGDEIQRVDVRVTGENVVNFGNIKGARTITLAGEGSIDLRELGEEVTTVDASGLKGSNKLTLDPVMQGQNTLVQVTGGAGDDEISVKAETLAKNARVDGGAGNDVLALRFGDYVTSTTTQYQMSQVEVLRLSSVSNSLHNLVFSGRDVTGLQRVELASNFGAQAQLHEMADANLSLTVAADAGGKLVSTQTGTMSVTLAHNPAATAFISTGLDFAQASVLDITVERGAKYLGTASTGAKTVSLALQGEIQNGSVLKATQAESIVISAVDTESHINIFANAAKALDVKAAQKLTLWNSEAQGLRAVESLAIHADDVVSLVGAGLMSGVRHAQFSGQGKVQVSAMGQAGHDIEVHAQGLAGGLELGSVRGKHVTLSLDQLVGQAELGGGGLAAAEADTVIVNASQASEAVLYRGNLVSNDVTVRGASHTALDLTSAGKIVGAAAGGAMKATVYSGIQNDKVTVLAVAATTRIDVSGDLGGGNDTVVIDGRAATASVTIDAGGLLGRDGLSFEIWGSNQGDIINAGAGNNAIRAGQGNDTIDLTEGDSDVVVFEGSAVSNGTDTITGFTNGDDVLNLTAFQAFDGALARPNAGSAVQVGKYQVVSFESDIGAKNFGAGGAAFSELFAGVGTPLLNTMNDLNGGNAVIIVQGDDQTQLYYVSSSDSSIASSEVHLVGTLLGITRGDALLDSNFAVPLV